MTTLSSDVQSEAQVRPYPVSGVLTLGIDDAPLCQQSPDASIERQSELRVRVKHHSQPWTLSCGMVVEVADANPGRLRVGQEYFLKMFDRRFAHQHRQDNGRGPWSQRVEDQLVESVLTGKAEHFLHRLHTEDDFWQDEEEEWDEAENEAFLDDGLRKLFTAETEAYARLREYQGTKIPRLVAKVVLDTSPSPPLNRAANSGPLFKINGILLEYLPGFTMSSMTEKAPQGSWQGIVDEAVGVTRLLGDKGILNADVRPDNFMVVPEEGGYRVCMVDFGQCRFRRPDESDQDWGRDKWCQDEEGAVGIVMRMRLRRVGFTLSYEPSCRYLPWAPGEDE